jgi:4-hydroxy-tetrahydrodipicolinate synthase
VYPTVVTPFCDGGVDTAALERQLRYELSGGVRGFLVLGTLGEGQYVTPAERVQVITTAVRMACGHVPVVVGIHTCHIDQARAETMQARDLGASAVLVKYLGNPKACPHDVLVFYAELSALGALPVFYYHYPAQTGLRLSDADVGAILCLPGVAGIKESTLNLPEEQAHIRLTCGLGKCYFTSTALNLTQYLDLGGSGAMCPEAVVLPGPSVQVYQAYVHGRHNEARAIQKELFVVEPIVSTTPLPVVLARPLEMSAADHTMPLPLTVGQPQARIKAALTCLGVPTPAVVKCPLPPLTGKDLDKVRKAVCRAKAIDWFEVAMQVPPEPLPSGSGLEGGGDHMLLKTGAIMLGPGVQKNLWRWQGDGEGGF